MKTRRRTRAVLGALLAGEHHGFEIAKAAGLWPGTTYSVLARLERLGWVESRWESTGRRRYRLTGTGAHEARALLSDQ